MSLAEPMSGGIDVGDTPRHPDSLKSIACDLSTILRALEDGHVENCHGKPSDAPNPLSGRTPLGSDSQVEFVDSVRLPPLDMLKSGKLGRPIDLRRTLTHVKLSGRLIDVILQYGNYQYWQFLRLPVQTHY